MTTTTTPRQRAEAQAFRNAHGIGRLLGAPQSNAKTKKSDLASDEFETRIMYLTPFHDGRTLCPKASPACRAACLYTAGRGQMSNVEQARIRKTKAFFADRAGFINTLIVEIESAERSANRKGRRLALRLNGTSDIVWERIAPELFTLFPNVQFYDYTKISARFWKTLPANYHLTFSRSESNGAECYDVLQNGGNVAVVYDEIPEGIFSGDDTDLRFTDPTGRIGRIIGLYAKGAAKHDDTGFVLRTKSA